MNVFKRLNKRIDNHTQRVGEMVAAFIVAAIFGLAMGLLLHTMVWLGILK